MNNELLLKQFDFIDCEEVFVGMTPEKNLHLGDCGPAGPARRPNVQILLGDCQEESI